jgi:hypothetical protein
MALLPDPSSALRKTNKTVFRNTTRCLKLTQDEARLLDEVSTSKGVPRSEWMRDVILRELRPGGAPDVLLAEVLGIRLLLVNVLRPLATGQKLTPEGFDKLVDDISRAKYDLATKLTTEKRRQL